MIIHHLNCGTLYPFMNHWIQGTGSFREQPPLVTHCLLVETGDSLLLVDTGFGRRDYTYPSFSVGLFRAFSNCRKSLEETAIEQVQSLGYTPADVQHIAITHMHLDHVGGLVDFPKAKVHIYAREYEGITQPRTIEEKYVCRREHWAHDPQWVIHDHKGDKWFGFACTPPYLLGDTTISFIPMTGHTRGHAAIALKSPGGWLLHCGDAYVYHGDIDPDGPHYPPKYQLTLKIMGWFSYAFRLLGVHSVGLRKLGQEHGDEVKLFCSHDPFEFASFRKALE